MTDTRAIPEQGAGAKAGVGAPHLPRLGRNRADHDKRTLQLAEYVTGPVVRLDKNERLWIPPSVDPPDMDWGMLENQNYSDCVPAALLHLQQLFSELAKQNGQGVAPAKPPEISDARALELYAELDGHDLGDAETDRGVAILHALKWWLKSSRSQDAERTLAKFGLRKISAFAAWEPGNIEQLKGTIATLGGVLLGLRMPVTARYQRVWAVPPGGPVNWGAPGSWDGHCVVAVGYNAECVKCVTWGGIRLVTWQFISAYYEEGFAVFGDNAEPNMRVFHQDGAGVPQARYVLQKQIELPGPPKRDLETAIAKDTENLSKQPRWGMGGRIWIDRPPPGHWEYVP